MNDNIAKAWAIYQQHTRAEEGPKPTAAGTLSRCSDTGVCLRQRGFSALKVEPSETIDPGTLLAFSIGNTIHDEIQKAVQHVWPDATVEDQIDLSHLGVSLSGHCDGHIPAMDAILEIKTISGYCAKIAWQSDAPKREHVAQAALYALGLGVGHVLMVYIAKEQDFRAGIRPGDMREWLFGMDEQILDGVTPRELAQQELDRFHEVEVAVTAGLLPDPYAPGDTGELELIDYPAPYGVQTKGGYWGCRYCQFNGLCREAGLSPSVEEVSVLLEGLTYE
jgi:hypothetical protein